MGSSIDRAIFNGARDAFAELESRYGKKFDLQFLNSTDADNQIVELGKSYINAVKGAIIFPSESFEKYSSTINEFVEKNLSIAFVGRNIPNSKALCYVGGDDDQMRALAASELNRLTLGKKKSIFIYGREDINTITSFYEKFFGRDYLQSLSISGKVNVESVQLYSIYASMNKTSILRRDDYIEIFTSPELLSDTAPIKEDGDRSFAMCIGALPCLTRYIERGELASCVYHDYYGWGYFAARTLAEKIVDNVSPRVRVRLMRPLRAIPIKAKSFKADWHNWTK